jgi:hypothetical protein
VWQLGLPAALAGTRSFWMQSLILASVSVSVLLLSFFSFPDDW